MWPFKPNVQKLKDKGDVEGLGRAAQHSDAAVRREAVEALGEIGSDTAIELTVAALADPGQSVQDAAIVVLKNAIAGQAAGTLAPTLAPHLGRLAAPAAAEPLRRLLELTAHEHPEIAASIVASLRLSVVPMDDDTSAACAVAENDWNLAVQLGAPAVKPLLKVLKTPKWGVEAVRGAAGALGRIGDPRAAVPLAALLQADDPETAGIAARALAGVGGPKDATTQVWYCMAAGDWDGVASLGLHAVTPVCAALAKPRWNSIQLIRALGQIGDAQAAGPLAHYVLQGKAEIAEEAVKFLSKLGSAGAEALRPVLKTALRTSTDTSIAERLVQIGTPPVLLCALLGKGSETEIRDVAEKALQKIGGAAVPALCETLESPFATARKIAVQLLGEIGDRRAVDPLVRRLEDEYFETCRQALEALKKIGWSPGGISERAVAALCRKLEAPKPDVRRAAAEMLRDLGDGRAIGALMARLLDDDPNVASAALGALRKLHWEPSQISESIFNSLCALLQAPSASTRKTAAVTLGDIGDSRAADLLVPLLEDRDLEVRRRAAGALRKLQWSPEGADGRVRMAIAAGRWDELAGQGPQGVEALVRVLLDEEPVDKEVLSALKEAGIAHGGDKQSAVVAAAGFLYTEGNKDRIISSLLEGVANPGQRRYLCSAALAGLYRAGQLSEEHKVQILAQRTKVVAPHHLDATDGPHYDNDNQRYLHRDGRQPRAWYEPNILVHEDYQFPASDCSHSDSREHRDSKSDVELL